MNFEYDPISLAQYAKFCNCNSQDCSCGENNGNIKKYLK